MNRTEHLKWAKQRALEYSAKGDLHGCMGSFLSDMQKHSELKDHSALELMTMLMFGGALSTKNEVEKFILGFN